MAEGGSFLNPSVGEPSRRAFLDVDRRVKSAQDDAASALAQIAALSPDHGSLLGLGDDDHSQYHTDARGDARYLQLSGGTVTGQTTFSATDGVKITGPSGGVWFDDRNGDGSKWVLYHSGDMIGLWNGTSTPFEFKENGVGYATNWSVGTGSSTNAFVGGSNYWRPQDAYGNSYFDINSGQFYVDSDTYYFRNRASTNSMTIDVNGSTWIRGTLTTEGRIYPRNWIEFSEYEGLYSPLNAAHFYPNNGSYGSWRVAGTRGNWAGLEFDNPNGLGNCSLMMGAAGSDNFGVHRNNTGWIYYFSYQDLYCNSYRGFNNVAGTGNASYHPSGVYSTGTNWLYGTIITNNNQIDIGSGQYYHNQGQYYGRKNQPNGAGLYHSSAPVWLYCDNNYGFSVAGWPGPSGGVANQIVWAYGNQTLYLRNWDNGGYCALAGIIYNQSTRRMKKDIVDFRPSSLSANANKRYATDLIGQLRPVEYLMNEENDGLSRIPEGMYDFDDEGNPKMNERRRKAYERLQSYSERSGNQRYNKRHVCGVNCDNSEDDPCYLVINGQRRRPGLIAEEIFEVIPGAINLDDTKQPESVDVIAILGVLVASNQELAERLDSLEGSNV